MLPKPSPLCRLCPSEAFCYLWMLDGFPWCSDSLCSRIASLDLDACGVDVTEVELDGRMVALYKAQEKKFLSQLDSLLEDLRGERPQPRGKQGPQSCWWQLLPACEGLMWGPGSGGEGAGDRFLWITGKRSAPKALQGWFLLSLMWFPAPINFPSSGCSVPLSRNGLCVAPSPPGLSLT